MPPQFGHGPDLFPDNVMLIAFSKKKPEGKGVPQVSQKAGIDGMNTPYDTQQVSTVLAITPTLFLSPAFLISRPASSAFQIRLQIPVVILMGSDHDKLKTFVLDTTIRKKIHLALHRELVDKNAPQVAFLFRAKGGVFDNPPDCAV
jgi:hypothetical protein